MCAVIQIPVLTLLPVLPSCCNSQGRKLKENKMRLIFRPPCEFLFCFLGSWSFLLINLNLRHRTEGDWREKRKPQLIFFPFLPIKCGLRTKSSQRASVTINKSKRDKKIEVMLLVILLYFNHILKIFQCSYPVLINFRPPYYLLEPPSTYRPNKVEDSRICKTSRDIRGREELLVGSWLLLSYQKQLGRCNYTFIGLFNKGNW